MKNLKKVLSLALALVMAMSLMTTAFAADFGDAAEIDADYTEAIDVMSAIGVFEGDNHGDFNPTGKLTREQGAKIITYMLLGADVADRLTADAAPFDDVAADRWSAGAIGYCSERGILDGNGAGKFFPTQELTGYAFAKMCLTALGYDAYVQGYAGTGLKWTINVASDAVLAGIDVEGVLMGNVLTREQAAQMAYQTLCAPMVQYASKGTNITLPDGTVVNSGASPAAYITAGAGRTSIDNETPDALLQFGEKYFTDLSKNPGELNGRQGYTWQIDNEDVTGHYTTDKVLATANDGITIANAINKTHKDFIVELDVDAAGTNYVVTYYLNGTAVTAGADNTIASFAAATAASTAAAKVGAIVEFIDTDNDGKANAINVIEKTVATLTGDASTKEVTNLDTQVKVPGITSMGGFSTTYTVENVEGYEGLQKGDVVLWYDSDGVRYIEKAASVEGVVSGLKNGDPVIAGTAYPTSGLAGASNAWSADYKNTWTFYLDNAGAVVKAVQETNESDDYAYVVESGWVTGTGAIDESNYAQAKLIMSDATTKVVTLAKVNGAKVVDTSAGSGEVQWTASTSFADQWYTYSINSDGEYELTAAAQSNPGAAVITNNKAVFATGLTGNANTIFIYETGAAGEEKYTAYTGIANVPGVTASAATDIDAVVEDGIATYVFVAAGTNSLAGDVGEYVYIPKNSSSSFDTEFVPADATNKVPAYYVVPAIVNGVEGSIKLAALTGNVNTNTTTTNAEGNVAHSTLYTVLTKDSNGIISMLNTNTTVEPGLTANTGVSVSGGVMTYGITSLKVTDTTEVYYIDVDGACTQMAADAIVADDTDRVYIAKASTDGLTAEIVYITEVVSSNEDLLKAGFGIKIDGAAQTISAGGADNAVTHTLATATAGQVITAVPVVSDGASITSVTVTTTGSGTINGDAYTVSASDSTKTITWTYTITAEDGTTVNSTATFVLTITTAS